MKRTPAPVGEAVFTSAHSALKFALNFTHGQVKAPFFLQSGGGEGRGLAGLDGAAQAGMIKAELERLQAPALQLLIGRFTVHTQPCACRSACCRGWVENVEWKRAIEHLTEYALMQGLTGTVSHYRLRRSLVMRYLGMKKENFIAIATMVGINRHTVGGYYKAVVERFRSEEGRGFHEIDGRLKATGVVES